MAASRLLGNVFGTSNIVWASIIGLILIYLAAGYFLGGKWADRSGNEATFYKIIIWSAISTALVPLLSRPVLRLAANAFDELQLGILFRILYFRSHPACHPDDIDGHRLTFRHPPGDS